MHRIDVEYLGRPNGIAACALETGAGLAIVDPGPASSLPGLVRGLGAAGYSIDEVRWLVLTHIHLDHSGGAGVLAREHPAMRVFVHERGARHLIDPASLLASAQRIYGDSLATLFGDVVPVPADRVTAVRGGETIEPGGRALRVEYAPGHARHHAIYLDRATNTAFVGDTAGERLAPSTFVMPVTPPPDIDLDAWNETTAMLKRLAPTRLFLTHFGEQSDVERHLAEHSVRLDRWAAAVRASLDEPGTDEERAARFAQTVEDEVDAAMDESARELLAHAGLRDSWFGLARYWRRSGGTERRRIAAAADSDGGSGGAV